MQAHTGVQANNTHILMQNYNEHTHEQDAPGRARSPDRNKQHAYTHSCKMTASTHTLKQEHLNFPHAGSHGSASKLPPSGVLLRQEVPWGLGGVSMARRSKQLCSSYTKATDCSTATNLHDCVLIFQRWSVIKFNVAVY